jgi:hypothetical protein
MLIATLRRGQFAAHLRTLLLQNRLAREPDAIAFHRQDLDQNLIAFVEFVAHVANAMLGDFADME